MFDIVCASALIVLTLPVMIMVWQRQKRFVDTLIPNIPYDAFWHSVQPGDGLVAKCVTTMGYRFKILLKNFNMTCMTSKTISYF